MKIKATVDVGQLPKTGDDWELYTCSMRCERAARSLTAALKRAIVTVARGATPSEAMATHFMPVAKKYADYGAQDSEPIHKAAAILDRMRAMTRSVVVE